MTIMTDPHVQGFELEIGPDARHVATARMFVAAVARHYSCDEERVQDLKIAISEACSNAIKAHLHTANTAPIRVGVTPENDSLRVEVVDRGPGFTWDRSSVVDFEDVATDPSELIEGGIGLSLIETLFPGLEVNATGDEGATLTFTVPVPPPSER